MTPFGLNSWGRKGRRTNNQKLKHVSQIIYIGLLVTIHRTDTSMARSVISELQTLLGNVGYLYAVFPLTFHLLRKCPKSCQRGHMRKGIAFTTTLIE